MKRLHLVFVLGAAMVCLATPSFATVLNPTDDGMIGRDWYSTPNSYWVVNTDPTVTAYHDGDNRWWYRGLVIFDISGLWGSTLSPGEATYNFYSNGSSGVALQYTTVGTATLNTSYGQISGTYVGTPAQQGWLSYDVTSFLQGSIDAEARYAAFVLNATVNYGSGSIAAVEAEGFGSYLQVGSSGVPEPASCALLAAGLAGLALLRRRLFA